MREAEGGSSGFGNKQYGGTLCIKKATFTHRKLVGRQHLFLGALPGGWALL